MPQRRLEHYFAPLNTPSIPSRPNFLDLPRAVRIRVYELIGLDDIFVDLNYTNLQVYQRGTYPETLEARKLDSKVHSDLRRLSTVSNEIWEFEDDLIGSGPGTSVWGRSYGVHQSMLLVSRQIHEEVVAITYAAGIFRVCLGQPLGFKRLWAMNHNALSYLGSLTVRLDVSHSEVYNEYWFEPSAPDPSVPDYLDVSSDCGIAILDAWKSTLDILKRSITPGQLRLRVFFRVKTMDNAKTLIKPMLQLPLLKDCGIRVELQGDNYWWKRYDGPADTEISRLVQKTIHTLVNQQSSEHFRFLDLPKELRLEILRLTDIVSPHVLQWRPYKRMKVLERDDCTYCRFGRSSILDEFECTCAPQYADMDYSDSELYTCCESCGPQDRSEICYCSAKGRIWSSSCNCYRRHSLFSVSRQVRHESMMTYYTYNKIVVTPYNSPLWRLRNYYPRSAYGIDSMPRIELSLYLSSIAPNALQHIRWLEWMLPSSQQAYLTPQTRAWYDYLDTLLVMQSAMNLSALTFTINVAASRMRPFGRSRNLCMPLDVAALSWYKIIILPVRRLCEAGLKDFFVHIRWHELEYEDLLPRENDLEHQEIIAHENDLERAVMGETYDSAKRGKPEERMLQLFRKSRAWMSDS